MQHAPLSGSRRFIPLAPSSVPRRPLHPCAHPGCPALIEERHCSVHQLQRQDVRREADRERGTASERGYDHRWRRYSAAYRRQHPLCVHCQARGRVTASAVVDHIVPHREDDRLLWDPANHQPLCKRCHDAKTAREDGGFGHERR